MPNKKVTDLTEVTTPADGDLVYIVDVSDTTDSSAGSSRYVQASNLRGWPRTAAEVTAGVTPTNLQYAPGDVRRYGAVDATDSTTAIKNAALTGHDIYIHAGESYSINNNADGQSIVLSTNDVRVYGGGKLTGLDDADHILEVTGDRVTVDGIVIQGDGTFTASTAVANASRIALIKVTGEDSNVQNCHLIDGPQNFIDYNGATGGLIDGNLIEGGITTFNVSTDTGYQGIRVVGSVGVSVTNNRVIRNASNGYPAEGIYFGNDGATTPDKCVVSGNKVDDSWDHAIYINNSVGFTVSNNILKSDLPPLVVAGGDVSSSTKQGHTVTGNNVRISTSTAGSGHSGIYVRDANNCVISGNHIKGCPRGIYIGPVTYSSTSNTIDNNTIVGNTILDFTDEGILFAKAGNTLGSVSRNVISGNVIVADRTNVENDAVAISMGIGQEAAANIAIDNVIANNVIDGSGNNGISVQFHTRLKIIGNSITDPAEATTPTVYAGIYAQDCINSDISQNTVADTNGTAKMRGGIDGNNDCTGCSFHNNVIINANTSYASIRRTQQASSGNSHRGNRTGDDPLTGTLTLANASTTTVNNDNWNYNLGYTSYVVLTPLDSAGAALDVWQDTASGTDRTSFVLDHSAAAGTEDFFYEIVQ